IYTKLGADGNTPHGILADESKHIIDLRSTLAQHPPENKYVTVASVGLRYCTRLSRRRQS
ncbi:hypothetical protein ACC839_38925, partial [Rhizobium ruizarguesonis]